MWDGDGVKEIQKVPTGCTGSQQMLKEKSGGNWLSYVHLENRRMAVKRRE